MAEGRNMDDWLPIETAPIDGTRILFVSKFHDDVEIAFYQDGHIWSGGFVYQPSAIPREWKDIAKCWLPLPSVPSKEHGKAALT